MVQFHFDRFDTITYWLRKDEFLLGSGHDSSGCVRLFHHLLLKMRADPPTFVQMY